MLDITQWLTELGLDEYAPRFEANDIDADLLPELDHELLQQIGVASVGHRLRILKAVERLQQTAVAPESREAEHTVTTPLTAHAERRQLTIMFVDLVGSTVLSRELDPEDLREINRAFQDAVKQGVEQFGGYVARYMGDGVLAYFGYPQAHENDAERAVHAGLALTEAIATLAPGGLSVRVGIATGPVVVGDLIGDGASQESAVVGETPNLASRLQGVAEPGTVVVSESTRALTGGAFTYEDFAPRVLKGFADPVPVARVVEPRRDTTRFEARGAGTLSPLVGRDSELALLRERWQQARAGDGQLVLVSGEAGIGKSRVVHAFEQSLAREQPITMTFQCSPHHARSPFFPVIGGVDRAAGIAPSDDAATKQRKIEAWLAQVSPDDAYFAQLTRALVLPDQERHAISPRELHLQFLVSLIDSPARPVLLVFEDMHWADPTTLAAAGSLMESLARDRVLVLMTARAEFEPPWAAPENYTLLSLNRLGRRQRSELVAALGAGRELSDAVVQRIIEQTDGVPLFVEEVTQAVLAGGTDEVSSSMPIVPATLHDSLLERLDQLGEAKHVAQRAAVIGREFSQPLLARTLASLNVDVDAAVARLLESGLVLRRRSLSDGEYFSFKHALVRDAAYESLLLKHRREAHEAVAVALEEGGADGANIEQLAWHHEQAGDALSATRAWLRATLLARGRGAFMEAAELASSGIAALEGLTPSAERDALEIALQHARGISTRFTVGFDAPLFRTSFDRVLALTKSSGHPRLTRTLFELGRLHQTKRDRAAMAEIHDAFTAYLDSSNPIDSLLAHTNAVMCLSLSDAPHGAYPHIRRLQQLLQADAGKSLDDDERRELYVARGAAMCTICRSGHFLGNFDTANTMATKALALAEKHSPGSVVTTLADVGLLHLTTGEIDSGRDTAKRILALASRTRQPFYGALGRGILFFADALDRHAPVVAEVEKFSTEWEAGYSSDGTFLAYALHALMMHDEWEAVDRIVARELPDAERLGWTHQTSQLRQAKAATAGFTAPVGSNAQAEAIAELGRLTDAALAGGALPRALSCATYKARLLMRADRHADARAALERVYSAFDEGFETPLLRQTKALIDQLG